MNGYTYQFLNENGIRIENLGGYTGYETSHSLGRYVGYWDCRYWFTFGF